MIIVDDDGGDFVLLKRALYKVGATARVWWTRDAGETVSLLDELIRSTDHVCVVLDVRLVGSDGWDLLARIKHPADWPHVKCVVLTGMSDQKTRARAEAEGVDAFFVKPCDANELVPIARALQKLACS